MKSRMIEFFKNNSGMSMASALVAAGIVAGLALVTTKIMTDSMKGQKKIENLSDISMLHQRLVRLIATDQTFCDNLVFEKVLGAELTVPTTLVTSGSPTQIKKMTLVNPLSPPAKLSATTVLATTPSDSGWDTFIEVEYEVKQNIQTYGSNKRIEYIPVMVDNFVVLGAYDSAHFAECSGQKILTNVQKVFLEEYDASNPETEATIGICKDGMITNMIKGCIL